MDTEFEFDPVKNTANQDKHGIGFVEGSELWKVPAFVQQSPFLTEPRWLRTGQLDDRFWTAVYTLRGTSVRLVSARRARPKEVAKYVEDIEGGSRADQEP